MMEYEINPITGGPAFPVPENRDPRSDELVPVAFTGMSLRDYFAGQAITGLMSLKVTDDRRAKIAYQIADAMLKERN